MGADVSDAISAVATDLIGERKRVTFARSSIPRRKKNFLEKACSILPGTDWGWLGLELHLIYQILSLTETFKAACESTTFQHRVYDFCSGRSRKEPLAL